VKPVTPRKTDERLMARKHEIHANADTVHWGYFDARTEPILTIDSGDEVTISTISGGPGMLPKTGGSMEILPEHARIHAEHSDVVGPHIMTGPIHVRGAEPGDVLEVHIKDVKLRQNWGYSAIRPLMGTLPEDFPETFKIVHTPIDIEKNEAYPVWGGTLKLAPFFGNIGVAPPPVYGRVTTMIPRIFGGNLDNKELVAGTTLYLPVFNKGGLLSVGDGHAVQGDGEVCVTALETALRGVFEIHVRKDMKLTLPRAETPTHHITMAFDVDLDMAAKDALRQMIDLVVGRTKLSREEAYILISLTGDLHVTQMVNVNRGAHVMLPKPVLAEIAA
jgi:acetamidase/formamidase